MDGGLKQEIWHGGCKEAEKDKSVYCQVHGRKEAYDGAEEKH